jgi:hypothetical protein
VEISVRNRKYFGAENLSPGGSSGQWLLAVYPSPNHQLSLPVDNILRSQIIDDIGYFMRKPVYTGGLIKQRHNISSRSYSQQYANIYGPNELAVD